MTLFPRFLAGAQGSRPALSSARQIAAAIGAVMFLTISYDITDNRRRTRLAKLLSNYGQRVQKSVFECQIDDRQYLRLKRDIEALIDFEEDSVRYYFLCRRCQGNIDISGWGSVREDEDVIIV